MARRTKTGDLAALGRYGAALGLAFQIRDDLIDVEVDAATAGKATGKDLGLGKATFVSLLGVEGARQRLEAATRDGLAALDRFGARADALAQVLDFNRTRRS
jgi:farnesyl diphosphate synthase